jgi:hypothetical protein
MGLLSKSKIKDFPPEVINEIKKLKRNQRKKAIELYLQFKDGKVINIKEINSKSQGVVEK